MVMITGLSKQCTKNEKALTRAPAKTADKNAKQLAGFAAARSCELAAVGSAKTYE